MNVITGGLFGKSFGNSNFALNRPPSNKVSGGPTIISSQWKIFSSSDNPTETPSGGFLDNSMQQLINNVRRSKEEDMDTKIHRASYMK